LAQALLARCKRPDSDCEYTVAMAAAFSLAPLLKRDACLTDAEVEDQMWEQSSTYATSSEGNDDAKPKRMLWADIDTDDESDDASFLSSVGWSTESVERQAVGSRGHRHLAQEANQQSHVKEGAVSQLGRSWASVVAGKAATEAPAVGSQRGSGGTNASIAWPASRVSCSRAQARRDDGASVKAVHSKTNSVFMSGVQKPRRAPSDSDSSCSQGKISGASKSGVQKPLHALSEFGSSRSSPGQNIMVAGKHLQLAALCGRWHDTTGSVYTLSADTSGSSLTVHTRRRGGQERCTPGLVRRHGNAIVWGFKSSFRVLDVQFFDDDSLSTLRWGSGSKAQEWLWRADAEARTSKKTSAVTRGANDI